MRRLAVLAAAATLGVARLVTAALNDARGGLVRDATRAVGVPLVLTAR